MTFGEPCILAYSSYFQIYLMKSSFKGLVNLQIKKKERMIWSNLANTVLVLALTMFRRVYWSSQMRNLCKPGADDKFM